MNTFPLRLSILAAIALLAISPQPVRAQNQHEMNAQAARDFDTADRSLNQVYKQLVAKLDKESQEKLKEAQKAWVAFRDAQAEFEKDREARGGSMAPLIYNGRRAALTKARVKELQQLLKEEGR